jgi:hypothetical protein
VGLSPKYIANAAIVIKDKTHEIKKQLNYGPDLPQAYQY